MNQLTLILAAGFLLAGCASGGPDVRVRGQLIRGAGFTECGTGSRYELAFPDTLSFRFQGEVRALPKPDRLRVELRGRLTKTSSGKPLILVMGYRDLSPGDCANPDAPVRPRAR